MTYLCVDSDGHWLEVEFHSDQEEHYDQPTVEVYIGDESDSYSCDLDLEEARKLHAALGRWLAEHDE